MSDDKALLVLKNVKVLFTAFQDEGMGRSITIDATNSEVQAAITKWYTANKVGLITKGSNVNESTYDGKPKFRDYDGTKQFTFKLGRTFGPEFISDIDGATISDVRYSAVISLVARAFEYKNKFGEGHTEVVDVVKLEKLPEGVNIKGEIDLLS